MDFGSIPRAGKVFNLHPATVRRKIKSGEWPYYTFGKCLRVDIDEIRDIARMVKHSETDWQSKEPECENSLT